MGQKLCLVWKRDGWIGEGEGNPTGRFNLDETVAEEGWH